MNVSEKIMLPTFPERRGRTICEQQNLWLKNLRAERKGTAENFTICLFGVEIGKADTLRRAKIQALANKIYFEDATKNFAFVSVSDTNTGIELWNK